MDNETLQDQLRQVPIIRRELNKGAHSIAVAIELGWVSDDAITEIREALKMHDAINFGYPERTRFGEDTEEPTDEHT